eukprot:jgi/Astpho2/2795/fgenesh1_pg.00050_%23_80_t
MLLVPGTCCMARRASDAAGDWDNQERLLPTAPGTAAGGDANASLAREDDGVMPSLDEADAIKQPPGRRRIFLGVVAVAALLLAAALVFTGHSGTQHPPSGVAWLPRAVAAGRRNVMAGAALFASASRSMPLATSRLLRLGDYLVMMLGVRVQQVLLANTVVKIFSVFMVALPLVWLGGFLYHWVSGEPLQLSLFKVYAVLYRAPVLARDHTLVLNWNPHLVPLLRQMALSRSHCGHGSVYDKPIVILAERDKHEMDTELESVLQNACIKVITRSGAPHFLKDLNSISAGSAHTVVLLHPENAADASKIKAATVLALKSARAAVDPSVPSSGQNIVIQTPEESLPARRTEPRTPAQSDQGLRPVHINGNRDITRLVAQTAIQPGVANVYCSLTQHSPQNGATFYIQGFPELHGRTYRDSRRLFREGILCGYISQDGALHLNPAETATLDRGDRLIVLANDDSFHPHHGARATLERHWIGDHDGGGPESRAEAVREAPPTGSNHKRIVVLGWPGRIDDLAAGLSEYAVEGTVVSVVSQEVPPGMPERRVNGCRFNHIQGDPSSWKSFQKAGMAEADSILLGSVPGIPSKEADAQMLANLMQIEEFMAANRKQEKPVHIVTNIKHPETVQVATEPDLAPLLSELVDSSDGQEIYLRRPERFGLVSEKPVSFSQVEEMARLDGETAIGYIESKEGTLHLAPRSTDQHLFDEHSRVVVIAGLD